MTKEEAIKELDALCELMKPTRDEIIERLNLICELIAAYERSASGTEAVRWGKIYDAVSDLLADI